MKLTRRQFLGGLSLAPAGFVMPGWIKKLMTWLAPETTPLVAVAHAGRITIPMFEIESYPVISIREIKERRFDVY